MLSLPPEKRPARMREVMERAHAARGRQELGQAVAPADELLLRYLAALQKVQRSTVRPAQ